MSGVCFGDAEDALDGVGGFAAGLDGFEIGGFVVDKTTGDAAVVGLGRGAWALVESRAPPLLTQAFRRAVSVAFKVSA